MTFVIRSMTTTDSVRGSKPRPYHIYLKPRTHRNSAWWTSSLWDCECFSTLELALAEARRAFGDDPFSFWQVAPDDSRAFLPYWEDRSRVAVGRY